MPASLKERSSRLQMFARLKSDSEVKAKSNGDVTTNANLNGNAVALQSREPERYQSSAPAFTSATERRELADSARVPVPGANARQPSIHQRRFSQPPPESVQRSHSQSPASQHRHMDIFTGSQLGDSFMNSGLTTPQYEPSEADPEPIPDKKHTVVTAPAAAAPTAAPTAAPATFTRPAPRYNFDRRFLPNDGAAFQIGEDLLMKVVPGARHHNPPSTYMNDGFNRAVNGYNRPPGNYRPTYTRLEASPEKQPNLPVRELKVRHVPRPRQIEYDDREKRSMSPGFATRGRSMRDRGDDFRPMTRFRDLEEVEDEEGMQGAAYEDRDGDQDDGTSTVGGREDGHATPRLRGQHPLSPHRAALERLMSTTIPPFKPSAPKDKKRRRGSLDYDDVVLSAMTYADLQNEPFDFDPSKATTQTASGATPDARTAKLEQGQRQSEKEQRLMFANMELDDWEEAGDWFAEQFSEIMHKMRVVRRNKRSVIEKFEKEAATREEAVRKQTVAIDKKLGQMLQDGQRMMTPNEAKAAKQ